MPCFNPQLAWRSRTFNENGKRPLVFSPSKALTDQEYRIPCGYCIGCKLEQSRQWAMRCVHEASLYKHNCFITLTYADKNLPPGGSLVLRDLQLFMKRLRDKNKDHKIRFYGCGEYGRDLGRPHYHVCLFNHDFDDKQPLMLKGKTGLFYSVKLDETWNLGFSTIAELNIKTARYAAKYASKVIKGNLAPMHYQGRAPEFQVMSRRPGLGYDWLSKYKGDIYPKDYVHVDGIRMNSTRYYDMQYQKMNPKGLETIKEKRRDAAMAADEGVIRRDERHKYHYVVENKKERNYEK